MMVVQRWNDAVNAPATEARWLDSHVCRPSPASNLLRNEPAPGVAKTACPQVCGVCSSPAMEVRRDRFPSCSPLRHRSNVMMGQRRDSTRHRCPKSLLAPTILCVCITVKYHTLLSGCVDGRSTTPLPPTSSPICPSKLSTLCRPRHTNLAPRNGHTTHHPPHGSSSCRSTGHRKCDVPVNSSRTAAPTRRHRGSDVG